jgi:hypothetical protein
MDTKSTIFRDVTPYSLAETYRHFGESAASIFNVEELAEQVSSKQFVPPKRRQTSITPYGVTSQKIVLFFATPVKTSNLIIDLFSKGHVLVLK